MHWMFGKHTCVSLSTVFKMKQVKYKNGNRMADKTLDDDTRRLANTGRPIDKGR